MIPTQPGIDPFATNVTINPFNKGWQCQSCGMWVGDMQFHNCSGTSPMPLQVGEITELGGSSGVADIAMYGDFKRLLKAEVVRTVKKEIQEKFEDESDISMDALLDVLDDVEEDYRNGNLV